MLLFYLSLVDEEDRSAFENLYNSYRKQMFLLSQSILHNKSDSEDAVHEVFLNIAIKHIKTVKAIESEDDRRNYMLKAAKHTALNIAKKKSRTISLDTDIKDESYMEKLSDDTFVEKLCAKIEYESLLKAISNLDEKYREVLYLHYVVELSPQEIADSLGRKTVTVYTQLTRGKNLLQQVIEKEGRSYGNY